MICIPFQEANIYFISLPLWVRILIISLGALIGAIFIQIVPRWGS